MTFFATDQSFFVVDPGYNIRLSCCLMNRLSLNREGETCPVVASMIRIAFLGVLCLAVKNVIYFGPG